MKWRREDLWYLLHIFHGIRYWLIFIVAMIWIRFLLMVLESATKPSKKQQPGFAEPCTANSRRPRFLRSTIGTEDDDPYR